MNFSSFLANHSVAIIASLVRASWQGGLFIMGVWLICRLVPRAPVKMRSWLWWLACLKPGLSLFAIPVFTLSAHRERFDTALHVLTADAEPITKYAGPAHSNDAVAQAGSIIAHQTLPWTSLAVGIWAVGVVVSLALVGYSWTVQRRLVLRSERLGGDWLTDLQDVCCEMNSRRVPTLLASADIQAPLVAGLLHPSIVIPRDICDSSTEVERRLTLVHEMAHVKRCDLWRSLPLSIVSAVFFFHPLVWFARREEDAVREEACDNIVLTIGQTTPARYGALLINLEAGLWRTTPAGTMGMSHGFRSLKRRLESMKQLSLNTKSASVMGLAIVAVGAVAALPWSVKGSAQLNAPPIVGIWAVINNGKIDDTRSVEFKTDGEFTSKYGHNFRIGKYTVHGSHLVTVTNENGMQTGDTFRATYKVTGNILTVADAVNSKLITQLVRVQDASGAAVAAPLPKPVAVMFPPIGQGEAIRIDRRLIDGRRFTSGYICHVYNDQSVRFTNTLPAKTVVQQVCTVDSEQFMGLAMRGDSGSLDAVADVVGMYVQSPDAVAFGPAK